MLRSEIGLWGTDSFKKDYSFLCTKGLVFDLLIEELKVEKNKNCFLRDPFVVIEVTRYSFTVVPSPPLCLLTQAPVANNPNLEKKFGAIEISRFLWERKSLPFWSVRAVFPFLVISLLQNNWFLSSSTLFQISVIWSFHSGSFWIRDVSSGCTHAYAHRLLMSFCWFVQFFIHLGLLNLRVFLI